MSESIAPIVRAFDLLRALNHQTHCSLGNLHRMTGIPKPSIHRLLQTLKNEGYVRSDTVKGTYSLTHKVRQLSDGFTEYDLFVELASPILLQTTRRTGFPLAAGVLEQGRMIVRYSSMPYSPIGHEHTTIGNTHDMLQSAMGQAFIAYCSATQRDQLMQWRQSRTDDPAERQAMEHEQFASIAATRSRGYGRRVSPRPHGSASIAVPVAQRGDVLGVVSLTTFSSLLGDVATIRKCLAILRGAAGEIEAALAHAGGGEGHSVCDTP